MTAARCALDLEKQLTETQIEGGKAQLDSMIDRLDKQEKQLHKARAEEKLNRDKEVSKIFNVARILSYVVAGLFGALMNNTITLLS